MTIHIECETCHKHYSVPDEQAGLRLRCVECESLISIPAVSTLESEASPSDSGGDSSAKSARSKKYQIAVGSLIVLGTVVIVCLVAVPNRSGEPGPEQAEREDPPAPASSPVIKEPKQVAKAPSKPKPPTADRTTEATRILRMCGTWHREGKSVPYMQLQRIVRELPEIKISQEPGRPVWNNLTLNKVQAGFCAVRFRSPLEEPANLFWTFGNIRDVANWYILPARGPMMHGFQSFEMGEDRQFAGLKMPDHAAVVCQRLLGGRILPGREYVLWFALRTQEAVDMHIAASLFPADDKHNRISSVEEISEVMGLKILTPDFEATDQGQEYALQYGRAQFLKHEVAYRQGNHALEKVSQALCSVASTFTEVPAPGENAPLQWKQIRSSSLANGLGCVRFRSSASDRRHLSLAVVAPETLRGLGLLPVKSGEHRRPDYELLADAVVSNLEHPKSNVCLFHHFADQPIEPGEEYLLWFATWERQPIPIQLALRLSADPIAKRHPSAQEIAVTMGVSLQEASLKDQLAAVEARVHHIIMNGRDQDDGARLARSVPKATPLLKLSTNQDSPTFNSLKLDAENQFVLVRRFRSPFKEPADMEMLTVGNYVNMSMNLTRTPPQTLLFDFSKTDLALIDQNLPTSNLAGFMALRNGPILPGQDYFVWIAAAEEKPSIIQLAVRLSPQESSIEPNSYRAVGTAMGFQFPVQPGMIGSHVLGEHPDHVVSVKFRKEGTLLQSAGLEGSLKTWDVAERQLLSVQSMKPTIREVFENDQHSPQFVFTTGREEFHLWDVTENRLVNSWPAPNSWFHVACLSPDDKRLAVCYADVKSKQRFLCIYETQTGEKIAERELDGQRVNWMAFSVDSKTLITVGSEGIPRYGYSDIKTGFVTFWEVGDLTQQDQLSNDLSSFLTADADHDQHYLAIGGQFGRVAIRDIRSRKILAHLSQEMAVRCVRMTPDKKQIVVGCEDGRIRLWDWEHNRIWLTLTGHSDWVISLDVSPDGQWLASGSKDGTVRLWNLDHIQKTSPLPLDTPLITNSLGMKLVPIPPGQFRMGTSLGENADTSANQPAHQVEITKAFYMGQNEVTVGQFREFISQTSAERNRAASEDDEASQGESTINWNNPGFPQTDNQPVTHVNWHEAVAFCEWLSRKEQVKYRLPTEAEWEYACRAGSQTSWYFGNSDFQLPRIGNIGDISIHQAKFRIIGFPHHRISDGFIYTSPVGSFLPNAFGLHDMHGNVAEWCHDWYDDKTYTAFLRKDPQGPEKGNERVIRGGSHFQPYLRTASSYRDSLAPESRKETLGFRLVRELP